MTQKVDLFRHEHMEKQLQVPSDHVIIDLGTYNLLKHIHENDPPRVAKTGKQHELKTDPLLFEESWTKNKPFEIRLNDRDFQVGDVLILLETEHSGEDMVAGKPLIYTGRKLIREITYILEGYGLKEGWVVMTVV